MVLRGKTNYGYSLAQSICGKLKAATGAFAARG